MAITFVGRGTPSTGDYGSRTPVPNGSTIAGDMKVLFAACRNVAGIPALPSGWTALVQDANVLVAAKVHEAGDTSPTVTFTGGALGDDTVAEIATWRGAYLSTTLGPTSQSNASAQDIALPTPATPNRASSLLLALGWKQDDWTSVATLGGHSEIGESVSIVGNDTGIVWDYIIQTTAAASPTGPFVVTGGLAAISKSYILALNLAPTITVTNYTTVYPPRNLITVGSVVVGDSVAIYRVVAGERTLIQAGSGTATDVNFLRVDATLPFGVAVSYVAVVNGMEVTSSAVTYTLPGGKVVVSDAIGDLAAEVVIWAWPEKERTRSATVFRPSGRNVVVAGDFAEPESDVELYTDAWSSAENLVELLENATQGIVQIRQPGGYNGVDGFYAVLGYRERRFSQDGSDDKRTHVLRLVEVSGWASALQALGFTYADLTAAYVGLTYANLSADYATYLLLDQADLS
jgi:hypothetical protein